MRNRKWRYLLLAVLLTGVALGYFVLLPGPPDPHLLAKSEQVKVGMSYAELKELIGTPTFAGQIAVPNPTKPFAVADWEVGETVLQVTMNDRWEVTGKTCGPKPFDRRLNGLLSKVFR